MSLRETNQGVRYTIGEKARREVLDRLLNHERCAEEVERGLHDEKKARKGGAKKRTRPKADGSGGPAPEHGRRAPATAPRRGRLALSYS